MSGVEGFTINGELEQYDYNHLKNKPKIPVITCNWSSTAIDLLNTILAAGVYTSDQSSNISDLITELSTEPGGIIITFSGTTATISGLANTNISYSSNTATVGGS